MKLQDRPLFGVLRPAPASPRSRAELRCRTLEVMAASVAREVPLAPVLGAAADEERGFRRRALRELRDSLDGGARLGAAMESSKLLGFPEHMVAAVSAAEGTPRLASVLAAAAEDDAAVDNRRASVWAAAFYPLLVVGVVGGVSIGLIGATQRRFQDVLECLEATGPSSLTLAVKSGNVAGSIAFWTAAAVAVAWFVSRMPKPSVGLHAGFRSLWQAVPGVRGPSRLGGASRLLRALAPCVRSAMPLHDALWQAAPAAGCRAVSNSALAAAVRAEEGASIEEVATALLLPAAVRARFVLAASRSPDDFAAALQTLAEDCAARYRDALEARMRWLHPALTVFVGAIVLTQLLGVFAFMEIVRRQASPW